MGSRSRPLYSNCAPGEGYLRQGRVAQVPEEVSTTTEDGWPRCLAFGHLGEHRFPYLGVAAARDLFEDALERVRQRYRFVVAGYVVMPEHVHLLIGEPIKGVVSGVIHALKLSVAMRRAERPFWQARSYDFLVHNEEKRVEKLRYMHRNPVVRGLVAKPEDWAWSSFRHYATGVEGRVEI